MEPDHYTDLSPLRSDIRELKARLAETDRRLHQTELKLARILGWVTAGAGIGAGSATALAELLK